MRWIEEIEHRNVPMSVKEAAKIYGDSVSNFYQKIRRGEIPGVFREKPRGRIKICPAEFAAWLRSRIGSASDGAGVKTDARPNAVTIVHNEAARSGPAKATGTMEVTKKEVPRLAR